MMPYKSARRQLQTIRGYSVFQGSTRRRLNPHRTKRHERNNRQDVSSGLDVHCHGLQLMHDPRAHLHQPMAVPKQLSQITILRTGYPDPGKAIFQQQLQQKFGIEAIGFLLADALFLIVYSGRGGRHSYEVKWSPRRQMVP
jgi:hypothetical protein